MITVLNGDCREVLKTLPDASAHCCVTSPPYFGLRDYGHPGQIGLEPTPEAYVAQMVAVFREVRRVLRDDGTLWLNIGDSYNSGAEIGRHEARENPSGIGTTTKFIGTKRQYGKRDTGLKPKDLIGIPWRVAFALQQDGWYLRQDIIWHKPNPMPESVTDRCTKAHEYIFLLSKSERYWFDSEAMKEPVKNATIERNLYKRTRIQNGGGSPESMKAVDKHTLDFGDMKCGLSRNRRSVWTVATKPYKGAHFATYPGELIRPCILAGCPQGGTVLEPFGGSGTTGKVAEEEGRDAVLVELNPAYIPLIRKRTEQTSIFSPQNPLDTPRMHAVDTRM